MRLIAKIIGVLLLSAVAFADPGMIINLQSINLCGSNTSTLCAQPTVKIRVCPYSYTNPPYSGQCASPIPLYTDPTLNTATTNPIPTDALGNSNVFATPGEYIAQFISVTGSILYQLPISANQSSSIPALALNNITGAAGSNTISNGNNPQTWNWSLTTAGANAFALGESSASTAAGTILNVSTLSGSSALPVQFTAGGTSNGVQMTTGGLLQAIGTGGIKATTTSLNVNTTSPLGGGGALTGNLTLTCTTCVVNNASNTYTAGPQDLNTFGATMEVANNGTGTTVHKLAKITATGAQIAATTDTAIPLYITDSGAGTSGSAKLAVNGQETCIFDSVVASTAGFYVIASTTSGGECHAQSAVPAGAFVVGHMVSNSTTSGGSATVAVRQYFVNVAGTGSGTVNSGTAGQLAGYTSNGTAVSGLPNFTFSSGALTLGQAGSVQGSLAIAGSTSGATTLAVPATATGTQTLQAATDTIVSRATSDTLTNKTYNAEATGNTMSLPARFFFPAAVCVNATSDTGWDVGTSNAPTSACQGTTVRKGVLQFARGNTAYFTSLLPADWNSGNHLDINLAFTTTDITNGHITSFNVQTGCNAGDGTVTDDPTLNTAQAASFTNGASAVSGGEGQASLTNMTTTGCTAGDNLVIAITRNNSGTDTNTDTAVGMKWAELIFSRSMNAANR